MNPLIWPLSSILNCLLFVFIVVECESFQVMNMINHKQIDGSYIGVIVREIWCIVSFFLYILFSHFFREASLVAHTIMHLTALEFSTRVWVGGCPSILDHVIASDSCVLNNNN